ncbi:MAG: hypothetical protein J6D34_07785 [Atopobiaceae bacterium]|nr:hypothetical protein [Atopobiaceae bacterium]
MTSSTSLREAPNLSRRSFFKLTVGSITLLPTVASVAALTPVEALADEEPRASLASGSTIYVVAPKELGLVVRDVSIEDGSANLIQGAHVKVTSRFNGKVLEDDTDDKGIVHFDISELAEDDGKESVLARYTFNATIEVTAQGYRDFRASRIRVEGGTTLGIPTQPRVSGLPYPVCVSFDEWDVLYSEGDDSTFVSSTGNDASHTIDLTINDCPAGASVAAGIYVDGRRVSSTTARASSDGTAQVALSDNFLLSNGGNPLPAGDDHDYTMRYEMGGTTYEVPIKLTVVEAPPEAQSSTLKKDLELSPFNDVTMFIGLEVPKDWAIIGGTKIKLWKPSFFFDCAYDPFGFIMIKLTPPAMGYYYDSGKPDEKGWQVQTRKWPQEQFKKTIESMGEAVGKTFDAPKGTKDKPEEIKNFNQIDFVQKFSFTVQPEIMAAATWEFGEKESRGRAQIALRIAANYSFSESFWAGPIPVLIRLGVTLSVFAADEMGYVSPSVWSFSKYRWDYSSTGFDLQICFAPTLAVGVGIGGVASIAIRGSFTLTFSLHVGPLPAGYKNLPNPHLRLAGRAAATVEAELLWFTNSWKLWNSDWPDWYNNWDGKLGAGNSPSFTSELEGKALADTFNEASIITTGDLDALAEFEMGGLAGMAQEIKLTGYTLFERGADGDTPVAQLYLSESEVASFASEPIVALEAADGTATDVVPQAEAPAPGDVADAVTEATGVAGDVVEAVDTEGFVAQDDAAVLGAVAVAEGLVAQDEGEMVADEPDADAETTDVPSDEAVPDEEQGLVAQGDETQPTYILRPSNDEIAAYEVGEVDAVPVGDHGYAEIPEEPARVLQLGLEQGFRPTTDIRLAENILLPSRTKIFTVGSNDYIARIGVARVAGQARTRVICQQVSGGDRRVLDFASNYRNDDCYDYDFDIATTRVNGVDIVSMVVISGTRPQGDATSFAQAATETFFSFVSCDNWDGDRVFTGVSIIGLAVDTIGDGSKTYPYRSYSCPRLVQIKGTKDGVEYAQAAVAYLERASIFPDQVMGTDLDLTRAGVGLLFFANGDRSIDVTSLGLMRGLNGRILDPTITDIALSGRADGYQLLELKGTEKTHYVLCETDPCWYIIGGRVLPRLESVHEVDMGEYDGKISRLISMESGSYFLGCIDGLLKRIDVNRGDSPSFVYSDFGGDELNMSDFGVLENGNVLYWAAAREDGGYTFDGASNDDPTLREDDGGKLTQIVGARVRGGKLSKSFPLCEVSHSISGIRTFGNSDDHMSFVSSNVVDLATGKGEQWYTAVPWVRCANLLESYPYDTLVAKGDQLPFYVTLRNDGNCYLSSVELAVAEIGGGEIGRIRLDFAEDNLVPSEWNPRAEDGSLENVEDDYALAPGTTSRYYASFVTIPEDWEGEKNIEVYVTAVYGSTVSLEGGLAAQADENVIDYIPEQRLPATLNLGSSERRLDEAGVFSRADITVIGSDGGNTPSDGGTPSGGGTPAGDGSSSGGSKGTNRGSSGSSSSASSRKGLAKTGDPTNTTTAAMLALGGVASIAAATALRHTDEEGE